MQKLKPLFIRKVNQLSSSGKSSFGSFSHIVMKCNFCKKEYISLSDSSLYCWEKQCFKKGIEYKKNRHRSSYKFDKS